MRTRRNTTEFGVGGAHAFALGVVALWLPLAAVSWAALPSGGIIVPRADRPAAATPGRDFVIAARLPLPLTPPPGVQSLAARKGWRARLVLRNIRQMDKTPREALYDLEVMRIRPHVGAGAVNREVYDFYVATPPWLPEGLYDVVLEGPGVKARSEAALCLSFERAPMSDGVCRGMEGQGGGGRLDLWIPAKVPGIEVRQGGRVITPYRIAWARVPKVGWAPAMPRVAQYRLGADGEVFVTQTKQRSCSLEIEVLPPPASAGGGLGAWTFRARDKGAAFFVWRFSNTRWGTGERVRHIFIESEPSASVVSFAHDAAACRARAAGLEKEHAFGPACRSAPALKTRQGLLSYVELLTRGLLKGNIF